MKMNATGKEMLINETTIKLTRTNKIRLLCIQRNTKKPPLVILYKHNYNDPSR